MPKHNKKRRNLTCTHVGWSTLHKHPNARFCSNKGRDNCKDNHHNRIRETYEREHYSHFSNEDEEGWDAHKDTF